MLINISQISGFDSHLLHCRMRWGIQFPKLHSELNLAIKSSSDRKNWKFNSQFLAHQSHSPKNPSKKHMFIICQNLPSVFFSLCFILLQSRFRQKYVCLRAMFFKCNIFFLQKHKPQRGVWSPDFASFLCASAGAPHRRQSGRLGERMMLLSMNLYTLNFVIPNT